jgi:hypothetical protein
MIKINCRIGNLELRIARKINSGEEYYEILEFFKDGGGMTIATFEKNSDGISHLKFVGDRPIRPTINWTDFEMLIRLGYELIHREFYSEG